MKEKTKKAGDMRCWKTEDYLKNWQSSKGIVSIRRMDGLNIEGSRNKANHYYLQGNGNT